ncbi:membrane protein [Streptomyces marokkonensis]|uniref:Membrane protein n=1 Tax=Streptomyces marokkonensis TaxID=324855 RepID=A0ABP7RD79_9ACTN
MDAKNRFETKATFALSRLEWLGFLTVSLVLAFQHRTEIRWGVFVLLFVVIDIIGYVPGAIAFRRSPDRRVPRGYYVAYNAMHSLVTAGVLAGAWALFVRPEWALLALPIHLMGDRALFGNSLKPFGVAFEPETDPAFRVFEQRYRSVADSGEGAAARTVEDTDAVRT